MVVNKTENAELGVIDKMNYGVIFHNKGVFRPTTALWRHIFRVPLPNYDSGWVQETLNPDKMKHGSMQNRIECVKFIQGQGNNPYLCQKFLRHMSFMLEIQKEGQTQLYTLIQDIKSLIPTSIVNDRQLKRALLPFVGSIMSSLFGVTTEKDTQTLNNNLIRMRDDMSKDMTVIKKTSRDMSSYVTVTSQRIEKLVEKIKENGVENVRLVESVSTELSKMLE